MHGSTSGPLQPLLEGGESPTSDYDGASEIGPSEVSSSVRIQDLVIIIHPSKIVYVTGSCKISLFG